MSGIWKPRPPSFPPDDKIPFTAAQVNEFDEIQDEDLQIRRDSNVSQRKQSEDDIEFDAIEKSKLYRARDSVFVRQKQRNSVVSTFTGSDDNESDDNSQRNVRFTTKSLQYMSPNTGVDNEGFQSEEVVLRNKRISSNNSYNAQDIDSSDTELKEETKAWDIFKSIPPPDEDETLDGVWVEFFIKCLKIFVYILTFVVVLGSAVISKSFILLMTSMTRTETKITICNKLDAFPFDREISVEKRYFSTYKKDDVVRMAWIWCLYFAVIAPDVFAFGRSLRICYFKKYKIPKMSTFLTVFSMETLHSIGLSLLVFLILPYFDAIKGSMMTNTMCLIPGLLILLKQKEKKNIEKNLEERETPKQMLGRNNSLVMSIAIVWQIIALIVWPIIGYYDDNTYSWSIPIALILISLNWWENFINRSSKNFIVQKLLDAKKDLSESRYFTYIWISIWKLIVVFLSMNLILFTKEDSNTLKTLYMNFTDGFNNNTIHIERDKSHAGSDVQTDDDFHEMTINYPLIPVWILLIQISATYLCYAFAKFTCKIHIQTISFAIPIHLIVPVTVSSLWILFKVSDEDNCKLTKFFSGFQYIFWYTKDRNNFDYSEDWKNYITTIIWALSLISQILITIHIWRATSARLASTEELFINPMYNSVLIGQSLAMNRRRFNLREEQMIYDEESSNTSKEDLKDHLYESVNESTTIPTNFINEEDNKVRIFACATMWHENKEEMIQMLKAVMRLDEDQFNKKMAEQILEQTLSDAYDIEFNIFFDDAFEQGDPDVIDDRKINRFVKQLIDTMDEAASYVHGTNVYLKKPTVVPTPYGGKLEWTLPGQNKLITHLKDKIYIRHRKRWSQCMYMYYLLGHRIAELDIEEIRKETISMNTYILALDGDINFRPQALHLVVDLMKKNKRLGAACGRIHPIGSGPMVWYQKFEYAIGHWLQKATEHVFGCVLCSPGCFSLFRARAVMDDSVMHKYTTKPTEAIHYVQYDQGEDRWLCTLLLQQGWRIEYCAASDSYTHAPEGFGEFYTQRRRWAPSTMANIIDLLGDYKRTVEKNTDISRLYILYQAMLMLGTVLSPGTIFLMVVGAMNTVMNFDSKYSLAINIVPILLFSIVCMTVKKNDIIINFAMVLSTLYALLMLAVLVGTAIDIKDQGPLTPNSIFFMGMMASFILAAIIHPQEFACVLPLLLYMLLIPSMYLLLTIYSVTNMHIVSWGTREVKSTLTKKEMAAQEAAAKAAEEAKKNKKDLFGFLNAKHCGFGLFTCMCCSNGKSDEDSAHLLEINGKLNRVNDSIENIKNNFDSKPRSSSIYRRKSLGSRDQNLHLLSGVTEEEEEEDSNSENDTEPLLKPYTTEPSIDSTTFDPNLPKWARDPTFVSFPFESLSPKELKFWSDFIPKYLLPLDENPSEQKRISDDLKDLRNKAVFAFGIINIVFILFVFLLQMHKDVFGIRIVSGIIEYNNTYIPEEDRYINEPIYSHTVMDPIGLTLVVFFGAILIIQMIGMFMHRFGTLAHLLAFTPIDFFDGGTPNKNKTNEDISKNITRMTRKIQKQGVHELSDTDNKSDLKNRRQSVFAKPQTAQPLNLHEAFKKRLDSIKPDDKILSTFQGNIGRKSMGQVFTERRKTIDWGKLHTKGDILQRLSSYNSGSRSPSVTPSVSSFIPPNPRPKSITFQMDSPTLMTPRRPSNLSVNVNKTLESPVITVTPTTPVNTGPPTGQHTVGYYTPSRMADKMSANIILNSLNEVKQSEQNQNQSPNNYQIATTSSAPDMISNSEPQNTHSNDSESNSTVSSNIDFNFAAFEESESSNETFPSATLHPTTIPMVNRHESDASLNKTGLNDQGEISTRL